MIQEEKIVTCKKSINNINVLKWVYNDLKEECKNIKIWNIFILRKTPYIKKEQHREGNINDGIHFDYRSLFVNE